LAAGDKGKVTVKVTEYRGWKNNLLLSNGDVELIVTLDVGPRVISYRLANGSNVFKEYKDQLGKSGEKDWQIRGGHRLWVGPEDRTRTYFPDNGPVKYKARKNRFRFTPGPETKYGLQKELVITLADRGSHVTVLHRLTNIGKRRLKLAPWALSVMAPGGVEVIPLPPKRKHPGPPEKAKSDKDYAPDQTLVLWPFFDFKDPRWTFGSKYITLRQDPKKGPTKIGLAHARGWVGYLNHGTLFVKRFTYKEGAQYPDNGSNFETFTNEDMLEIETLGPVVTLPAGQTVELTEKWELIPDVSDFKDETGIDRSVLSKVNGK
jgi:hypothetical protein